MHSSRMRTARSLSYGGFPDRNSPGQRPSGQDLPGETPWTDTPLQRPPYGDPPGQNPPPPAVDRQTPVKTLPLQSSFADGN